MQRTFLRALLQHADGICLTSCRTSPLRQGRCLKLFPIPPNIGYQMTVRLAPQKQWLHASSAPGETPGKKPIDTPSAQPEDLLQKEHVTDGTGAGAAQDVGAEPHVAETDPLHDRSLGLYQRFKRTFKQYGKVLIPVHLVTSSFWFGSFYYAAMKGVNVVPFLEFIGLPESIIGILKNSQSGNALTAYALYKIATPARYTVTLGGTSISVKYLRKYGYMSTPPPVKDYLQDRMEETKELFTGKMGETRDIISGKMEETKDRITEKIQETKDSFMKKKDE